MTNTDNIIINNLNRKSGNPFTKKNEHSLWPNGTLQMSRLSLAPNNRKLKHNKCFFFVCWCIICLWINVTTLLVFLFIDHKKKYTRNTNTISFVQSSFTFRSLLAQSLSLSLLILQISHNHERAENFPPNEIRLFLQSSEFLIHLM